jgi:hypothetical protein
MVTKVEKNPLKKVTYVENAIAATFDYFDFVIQPLDKTTALVIHKIVQDFWLSGNLRGKQPFDFI